MWFRVSWVRAPLPTPDYLAARGRSVRSGLCRLSCPTLGCSQVVRHGTLTPAFAGSSPAIPASRRNKLHIPCPDLQVRPRLFRCSSFPHKNVPFLRGPRFNRSFSGCGLCSALGFEPHIISYDSLAQLVEQRPFKAKVRGSSPRRVTTKKARTACLFCYTAGVQ